MSAMVTGWAGSVAAAATGRGSGSVMWGSGDGDLGGGRCDEQGDDRDRAGAVRAAGGRFSAGGDGVDDVDRTRDGGRDGVGPAACGVAARSSTTYGPRSDNLSGGGVGVGVISLRSTGPAVNPPAA